MKVVKFSEYSQIDMMAQDFINSFESMIIESSDKDYYKTVQKKVISDLKLNLKLVFTFGAGIGALYPIVDKLMTNSLNYQSVEITPETIVMLTMAAIAIIFIEEKKYKDSEEEASLIKDSKSLLEELKMRGVGNGIVKKVMKAISSIKNVFYLIGKHIGTVLGGIIDMFAYTSLLIPIMNGVLFIVNKYDLSLDTLCDNFLGLAMGITTIIAKHGIIAILNRIKDRFNISQKKVIDELETPVIQRFSNFSDGQSEEDADLIKEQ